MVFQVISSGLVWVFPCVSHLPLLLFGMVVHSALLDEGMKPISFIFKLKMIN